MFTFFNCLYGTLSVLAIPLWYKYFVAHTFFMSVVVLIVAWNGACYYMDVFAKKGHIQS